MKKYIVIGGSSGIGFSIVNQLLNDGHTIGVLSRSQKELPDCENMYWSQWDSTLENTIEDAFDNLNLHGIFDSIDGLVYCPGTVNLKSFNRITTAEFANDYNVNVIGAIRAIQFFLPHLKKSTNPSIVLFSTVAVQTGMLFHTLISTSKGAVEGLTRSLAADLSPNIRVNCIAPSLTKTPLTEKLTSTEEKIQSSSKRHPLGKIGEPHNISDAAVFLLSEKSSWITGQIIHVDGGLSNIKL